MMSWRRTPYRFMCIICGASSPSAAQHPRSTRFAASDTFSPRAREELLQRARELARFVVRDTDGSARTALPAELEQIYRAPDATDQYAIRTEAGQALAASQPEFVASTSDWPLGTIEPRYIRLKRF